MDGLRRSVCTVDNSHCETRALNLNRKRKERETKSPRASIWERSGKSSCEDTEQWYRVLR